MLIKTLQQAKRLTKIVIGFTILLAGIVMLVTPGPGWLAIGFGLFLLAEFAWARRLLNHLKEQGGRIRDAVFYSNGPAKPPRFVWARRLLDYLKELGARIRDAVYSSGNSKNPPDPPAASPK